LKTFVKSHPAYKVVEDYFMIALGAAIMAFGIINFSVTANLASGGITGITLILFHVFGMNIGLSFFLINIPLLIIFWRYSTKAVFVKTIFGYLCLSGFSSLFEWLGPIVPDMSEHMILAAICFGACIGVGTGMILKREGTTAGTIVVAKLLQDLFQISVVKTLLVTDAIVIIASLFLFVNLTDGLYSLLALFVCTRTLNKMQEGFMSGYKVLVFTDHPELLAEEIYRSIHRGVTFLRGKGGYRKEEKDIVMVIVDNRQLVKLKNLVSALDPDAFVSVSRTHETLGEGFTFDRALPYEKIK